MSVMRAKRGRLFSGLVVPQLVRLKRTRRLVESAILLWVITKGALCRSGEHPSTLPRQLDVLHPLYLIRERIERAGNEPVRLMFCHDLAVVRAS